MLDVIGRLSLPEQLDLVALCREIVREAPLLQKTMPNGAAFKYLCTSAGDYGWVSDRQGYRYVKQHPGTGRPFPPMPALIRDIALDAAAACGMSLDPQSALINWYGADGRLGLHQDRTEISLAPVVSISLGDDAVFVAGGPAKSDPRREILLQSGDVLVMGGEDRLAYHGVKQILPGTAPTDLCFRQPGRINITVRQVY